MPERNDFVIDERLANELSGREKLAALLRARGYTYQRYAKERGFWPEQVKMTIYGTRPYAEIRDALAEDLEIPRTEIDRLIEVEATPDRTDHRDNSEGAGNTENAA